MAKRKLSIQQRQAIRKEIRQGLAAKKRQIDVLRTVAEKYKIATITARWYLNSLAKPKRAPRKVAAKKGRKWTSRKSKIDRRNGSGGYRNGSDMRAVNRVRSAAEDSLKRVLEVKKLIPKWQVYVKKEASLRHEETRLRRALNTVSSKARLLRRRIEQLSPQ